MKKKCFIVLSLCLIFSLLLVGCSSNTSDDSDPDTASISGQVMVPGATSTPANIALFNGFINKVFAESLAGEVPLANASIVVKNFATGELLANVETDENGQYTVTGIPANVDVIVIATDESVRVSGIVPDVGEQSTITGDLNVTTTLVAEELASKGNVIDNVTTDSLDSTLVATEQYILNNHTNNEGDVELDLTIDGSVLNENVGDGIKDTDLEENINDNFFVTVSFNDPDLEDVIREKLNKREGSIYKHEVEQITELQAANSSIDSLEGMDNLTSLEILDLGVENVNGEWLNSNNISDLTPLSQLTTLQELLLYNNNISDLTPLSNLINLTRLSMDSNNISDISPLSSLDNLIRLDMAHNSISYINNLPALDVMESLDISDNNIDNIAILSSLTNINWLGLTDNQVSDVSVLSGLSTLESLYLNNNPITDYSPLVPIFSRLQYRDFGIIGFTDPVDGQIYITNLSGVKTKITGNEHDYFMHPRWSPDKSKIAFSSEKDGEHEIYIMDADGTNIQKITDNNYLDLKPSWSPDGSKLAFNSNRGGDPENFENMEIYTMNIDGSNVQQITNNSVYDSIPLWSPDGQKLIFSSERDCAVGANYEEDIFVVDLNTQDIEQLTANIYQEGRAIWSPDGNQIAWQMAENENSLNEYYNIYTMDADGTNITPVTNNEYYEWCWDWSADGNKILFTRGYFDENTEIYTVNTDGTGVTKVCDGALPQWFQ